MKIAINVGHGGRDPGAIGTSGLHEATQNNEIARIIAADLLANGQETLLIQNENLAAVVLEANDWSADVFISIHANSAADRSAHGVETYYLAPGGTGEKLAMSIQKNLTAATGLRDRGTKTASFYVLRNTAMPAVLVEVGFISNQAEEARMNDSAFDMAAAQAIAKGIAETLKIPYTPRDTGAKTIGVFYYGDADRYAAQYVAQSRGLTTIWPRSTYKPGQYDVNIFVGGSAIPGGINLTGSDWVDTMKKVIAFIEEGKV